jgi:hypothetical protein
VNREVIDVPTGDFDIDSGPRFWTLAGATDRATNETGEDLTVGSATLNKTLWWELRVPFTCIVKLDAAVRAPYPFSSELPWGYAQRGASVNATSPYADGDFHFGEQGGRGADGRRTSSTPTANHSGLFPHTFVPDQGRPCVFQVTPDTPLVFSAAKRNTLPAEIPYNVYVRRLNPPENDRPTSALELDPEGGSVPFSMEGATGESLWNWALLETWMNAPISYRFSGDIFYQFTPSESGVFRFSVSPGPLPGEVQWGFVQVLVFDGADITSWTPLVLNETSAFPYAVLISSAITIPTYEVDLVAGRTYTIAFLQTRSVLKSGSTVFQSNPLREAQGTFTWEYITTPRTNDDFADRFGLIGALPISTTVADTRAATAEPEEPIGLITESASGVWYEYITASSGWYLLTPDVAPTGGVYWDVYRTDPAITPIFPLFELVSGDRSFQPLFLRAGDTYYIRATPAFGSAYDHQEFTLSLVATTVPANDDFANRQTITGATGEVISDLTGATSEFGEPIMYWWNTGQSPSVWFEWTAPTSGPYTFRAESSDASIGVYTGSTLSSLTPIARYQSYDFVDVRFNAVAGTSYKIQVGDYTRTTPGVSLVLKWAPSYSVPNLSKATAAALLADGISVVAHNGFSPPVFSDPVPSEDEINEVMFEDDLKYGRGVWYRIDPVFDGEYTISASSSNWQAGLMIIEENGDLVENLNGDPATFEFAWYDGDSEQMDLMLTARWSFAQWNCSTAMARR